MKKKVPVYWRRRIVRAIEDGIILTGLFVGAWLVGSGVSLLFSFLKVLYSTTLL